MTIRRAVNGDIPKIHELLEQVCLVHHNGRPDLFKFGARKYTDEELKEIIADDSRPIFFVFDEKFHFEIFIHEKKGLFSKPYLYIILC